MELNGIMDKIIKTDLKGPTRDTKRSFLHGDWPTGPRNNNKEEQDKHGAMNPERWKQLNKRSSQHRSNKSMETKKLMNLRMKLESMKRI